MSDTYADNALTVVPLTLVPIALKGPISSYVIEYTLAVVSRLFTSKL